MIAWVSLMWSVAPVEAATWTYRAPVPIEEPTDGKGFKLCLDLPAKLDMERTTIEEPGVSLTCESNEETTSICYEIGAPWPTEWSALTCEGGKTRLRLQLVPAFDPNESIMDGGVTIATGTDEIAAVYALPAGTWPEQIHNGARGTICKVEDQRLWIWREGTRRGKGTCEIRNREGDPVRFTVRFGRVRRR